MFWNFSFVVIIQIYILLLRNVIETQKTGEVDTFQLS